MKTILIILKINILSLLSFPLLLISMIAMLLQKAVEKTIVFIGVGAALLMLMLLNTLLNNPGGFLEGLAGLLAILILFGIFIAIIVAVLTFFGSIAVTAITVITSLLIAVFRCVFQVCHEGYSKLFDICKADFEKLKADNRNRTITAACIFWYFLTAFNKVVVTVFSFALPISIICAIGFAGYSIFYVIHRISKGFGIGIWQYLKLFPTTNSVFTVLYFVIIVLAVIIVIITLGMEWNEWGTTLKFATQDYGQYRKIMSQKAIALDEAGDTDYTFTAGKDTQKCEEGMETLQELFNGLDFLHQQVDAAINIKQDSSLTYDFASYVELLEEIHKKLESQDGSIPCSYFEQKLLPLIHLAKKRAKAIEKDAFSILNAQIKHANKQNDVIDFFAGCETPEEIQKRYKSLCKVYHPDAGGHEDTFKQLQGQHDAHIREKGEA